MLRLVPYVGIWISATLATALAAAVSPGWSMAIWSLALFVSVEGLVGQVVEPLLYGRSTGLSPFSVVVAAIFWSWIWGPIGLILSTPLTLCLLVLGRHIRRLEFLDVLLGDQPALTPIENFYQYALVGDPDEALAQAEVLLRERSLSAYYDEVALKGLQLAAHDVVRGSVTAAQLARIEATTNDIVDGLDSYEDRESATQRPDENWGALAPVMRDAAAEPEDVAVLDAGVDEVPHGGMSAGNRVLCIPGRGPLDALATTILFQVLGKHQFAARVVPHEAASRASIDSLSLDADDVGTVCVFYLQIDGIPSHLRYLVKRVRQRLPRASILIGVWPAAETEKWSGDLQSGIGVDFYVASVREMVRACRRVRDAGGFVRSTVVA